jgi:hypothetical protein
VINLLQYELALGKVLHISTTMRILSTIVEQPYKGMAPIIIMTQQYDTRGVNHHLAWFTARWAYACQQKMSQYLCILPCQAR